MFNSNSSYRIVKLDDATILLPDMQADNLEDVKTGADTIIWKKVQPT